MGGWVGCTRKPARERAAAVQLGPVGGPCATHQHGFLNLWSYALGSTSKTSGDSAVILAMRSDRWYLREAARCPPSHTCVVSVHAKKEVCAYGVHAVCAQCHNVPMQRAHGAWGGGQELGRHCARHLPRQDEELIDAKEVGEGYGARGAGGRGQQAPAQADRSRATARGTHDGTATRMACGPPPKHTTHTYLIPPRQKHARAPVPVL